MYCRSIVTFMDILGFKEIVRNRSFDEVKAIIDLMQHYTWHDEDDPFAPEVIAFSDSIIRVRPVDHGPNTEFRDGCVFWEVLDLLHAQMNLVNKGILVRGGISIGDIFIEDGQVFGPGLISSYELEMNYANYPRIVISPDLIRELDRDPALINEDHDPEDEKEYLAKILTLGEDGLYFVDYLGKSRSEVDDPSDYAEFLVRHKQIVLESTSSTAALNRTSATYLWLANYHNSVVSGLKKKWLATYGLSHDDLRIAPSEMQSLCRL